MTASDDLFEVLRTTRSVRRRLDFDRAIEPELIEECIDAAVQAPTGLNLESWRFVVLTEAEPKARIAELYRRSFDLFAERTRGPGEEARDTPTPLERPTYRALAENLHRMPALILVCSEGRPDPQNAAMQLGFYASVLPAAWSLMLALRAKGVGATWTTLLVGEEGSVAEALNIPADVTQTVLLPIAYTRDAVLRPANRRPAADVTYWNGWGRSR
ncbi:MAG: nitroreductase family protein [Deltaproteobacteria bacterium]|jgi:nitroreductase|nr:nitroreductase family protein [Deltaproteobacteria bacterium]